LKMYDRNFNPIFRNLAWVKKEVSKRVNAALGIKKGKRVAVTNEQYQQMDAAGMLTRVHSEALQHLTGKLRERS
jgi:hypothetical protein